MLNQNAFDQIVNDLEEILDKSPQAKLTHDLIVELDTARMELEESPRPPCMKYSCVCLESEKEANLLLTLLQTYAYFFLPIWREDKNGTD